MVQRRKGRGRPVAGRRLLLSGGGEVVVTAKQAKTLLECGDLERNVHVRLVLHEWTGVPGIPPRPDQCDTTAIIDLTPGEALELADLFSQVAVDAHSLILKGLPKEGGRL